MQSTPHSIYKIVAYYYNNDISINDNINQQNIESPTDYYPLSQSLSDRSNISPLPSTPSDKSNNNDIIDDFLSIPRSPTPPTQQILNNPSRVLVTTGCISRSFSFSLSYHSDSDQDTTNSMELYDYINEPWPDIHHVIDYNHNKDDEEERSDKFVMIILIKLGLSKYHSSFKKYFINKAALLCLDMSLIPMLINNNINDQNIFFKWINRYKQWKGMNKRIMFNMDDLRYLDHEMTLHVFGFVKDCKFNRNQYIPDVIQLLILQYYLYLYMNIFDIDEYCMCWTDLNDK